jgi:hypothetical protein
MTEKNVGMRSQTPLTRPKAAKNHPRSAAAANPGGNRNDLCWFGVHMADFGSIVSSNINVKIFAVAPLFFAALACISLAAAADQNGLWQRCRAPEPDVSITACSEIIARRKHEKKSRRIEAYINRGSAYRLKGELDLAIADLHSPRRMNATVPVL